MEKEEILISFLIIVKKWRPVMVSFAFLYMRVALDTMLSNCGCVGACIKCVWVCALLNLFRYFCRLI